MAQIKDERRTVKVRESTYQAIKKLGEFGETFDDVIQRILEIGKDKKRKDAQTAKSKSIASKLG